MIAREGFSLIECMIYCAIASYLSIMAFAFFNRTLGGVQLFSFQQQEMVSQWSIQQLLRKDIQMASADPNYWKLSSSSMVCRVDATCIGWYAQNGNLYRTKGNYDFSAGQWLKKSTALVAKGVNHFNLEIHQAQTSIEAVSYKLKMGKLNLDKKIRTGLG